MKLSLILTVLRKELRDGLRDRRAIATAMFFPLFGPALVYFMLSSAIDMRKDLEVLSVPVIGSQNAPDLGIWFARQGVKVEEVTGDPEQLVRDRKYKVVVVVPDNFGDRMAESRTAFVELVSDGSRNDARAEVEGVRALLTHYGESVAFLRLIARGVAPEITKPVLVQNIEVASKQQIGARAMTFIPMYIVMAAFICGLGLAVDSTAGERERATLESLLINPVERTCFVIGKWLAASLVAAAGVILTTVACFAVLARIPLEEIGISFSLGPWEAVGILLATFPMAMLATSMQLLLGIFAKSFKDAQGYIGLLVLVPMIPALISTFRPIPSEGWMSIVPILGQHLVLTDVVGGKAPGAISFLLSAMSALVVAYLCIVATARLFSRESIIFSH